MPHSQLSARLFDDADDRRSGLEACARDPVVQEFDDLGRFSRGVVDGYRRLAETHQATTRSEVVGLCRSHDSERPNLQAMCPTIGPTDLGVFSQEAGVASAEFRVAPEFCP